MHPLFVDREGHYLPTAKNLNSPDVAGYRIEFQAFGFGHLRAPNRPPIASTIRAFASTTFDIHMGMPPNDPTGLEDTDGDGFSKPSNAGCPQPASTRARDRGRPLQKDAPVPVSKDDPDRDGYLHEISEGDLDVLEWYSLNHPRPGRGEITDTVLQGEQFFHQIGCANCHVPDWDLPAQSPGHAGERRFFDLTASWNAQTKRLEGKLTKLQKGTPVAIRGLYSDMIWHHMGPEFTQIQYDGTQVHHWRTPPLWGVADSAPYGHDGASRTLDAVIRRHGGEAQPARVAYESLTAQEQESIVQFLQSLILYSTDTIPCDINGDGLIGLEFRVAGVNTGQERANPEWLMRTPGRIEGLVSNTRGETILSSALVNLSSAWGLELEWLRDSDGDGFPDKMDSKPGVRGYRDGER